MFATTRGAPTRHAVVMGRLTASPPSHWLAHRDDAEPPPPIALPREADVVVIGGGVMGVATTYWLARRGVDVTLLEARRLGWGATGRNAGLMLPAPQPLEDLASLRAVLREERIDAEFEEQGHLALASSPAIWDKMRGELARRPASAPPLHVIEHGDCERLLEMRIAPSILGGRWLPGAAVVHPVRFVLELAERAQRRGATIACGVGVQRLERGREAASITVTTTRGRIKARSVMVACGVRTSRLLPELRPIVRPSRGQVCSTVALPRLFNLGLAVDWGTYYWRQARDGAVVLGGGRHHDAGAASVREIVNDRVQRELADLLPTLFPDFPAFQIERRWAGIMDDTADGRPVVGRWPHAPNIWVAAGFGGHGLPPALGVGAALAESIQDGRLCPLLSRLDPVRFHTDTT